MIDCQKYGVSDVEYTESYTPSFEGKLVCSYTSEEGLENFVNAFKEENKLSDLVYTHNTGTRAIRVFKDKSN